MPTPSNPGWVTGFVPTAAQWAAAFSGKVDYPAPVNQGGTGAQSAAAAAYALTQRGLISATPTNLTLLGFYGFKSSLGAFSAYLPALSTTTPGDWISVADIDYNANVNGLTVYASGSDVVALYGASSGSQVLNVAGFQARFVANSSAWRLLV